jgi:hypothetical protein
MKRIVILVLLELLGLCCVASAQSLSPLSGEGGKGHLKGSFTISNPEVIPMVTTVETRSASWAKDGSISYRPVDQDVTVHIAETSARIGPRQSHTFYYDIECRNPDACLIAFLPGSTFGKATSGMQVKVILPHTVYVCQQGAKGCRQHIRQAAGLGN